MRKQDVDNAINECKLPLYKVALARCGGEIKTNPLIGYLVAHELAGDPQNAAQDGCTQRQLNVRQWGAKFEWVKFVTHELFGGGPPRPDTDEGRKYTELFNEIAEEFHLPLGPGAASGPQAWPQ